MTKATENNSVDEGKNLGGEGVESPRPALESERDWLHDHTRVTVTVQDVANRLHQDMYSDKSEHLAVHSCPCSSFARWYLGVDEKPRLYWPDGKGGNAWDKKDVPARETESDQG